MNLKQLEAFVSVAENGSYSKAARQMYLTQPTVSAHIFSLEKELGRRLFVRSTKEVYLTEDGKSLYKYAKEMVTLEQKILEQFTVGKDVTGKVITIAASTIPSQYLLPEILLKFRKKYPEEQIKITETDSQGVIGRVVDHEVDVGFTGTVLKRKYCVYLPFFKDELVIMTPNNEHYQRLKEENPEDLGWLKDENIILREEGSGTRNEALKVLHKQGIELSDLKVVATIENQETIKKSVLQGMGISILSKLAALEDEKAGRALLFQLPSPGAVRDINLVYNKNYPLTRTVHRFIKVVEDMCGAEEHSTQL